MSLGPHACMRAREWGEKQADAGVEPHQPREREMGAMCVSGECGCERVVA